MTWVGHKLVPVLTVVLAIVVVWYAGAVGLNARWAEDKAQRAGVELSFSELVADTWSQDRPKLPTPVQVVSEMWKASGGMILKGRAFSKRSLIFHGWVTLSATLLGFVMGTSLGALLAVGIVHNRAMDMSVMPWVIASQTVPILAIAPMIVVVLNALQVNEILAKGVIAMYLSFFPVVVGLVKGFRAPDTIQMDLFATYNANRWQTFWKLRLPSSAPFLFPSLKVGIAASLIGAVVAELSLSQNGGLGARLLVGSYYGQTIQIWAALFSAAVLAGLLVMAVGVAQTATLRKMGMHQ